MRDRSDDLLNAICCVEEAIEALKVLGENYAVDVNIFNDTLRALKTEMARVDEAIAERAVRVDEEIYREYLASV